MGEDLAEAGAAVIAEHRVRPLLNHGTVGGAGGDPRLLDRPLLAQRPTPAPPRHIQSIAARGACGKTRVGPQNRRPDHERTKTWGHDVCVLLSTDGDAVTNRWWDWRCGCGRWVRVCAPPDWSGEGSER